MKVLKQHKSWVALLLFLLVSTTQVMASGGGDTAAHHELPIWTVLPFVALLLMIATGPLFYEHFWHKNYPLISVLFATFIILYYIFGLENMHSPIHAAAEYVQFISLLAALYIASGGIMINVDKESTPQVNVVILLIGAISANLIGTTGASMLLIRPYMRLNRTRLRSYHIVFFIFVVSNIGGSLTPIGDPPLFLGFLKGVPFFWTLTNNFIPWVFAVIVLLIVFYFYDKRNTKTFEFADEEPEPTGKVTLIGYKNFIWLGVVIAAVFLDPNVVEWVPYIPYEGAKISFVRELTMLFVAWASYRFASKDAINGNQFSFEPIREVAFIFIGIFGTMMPALEMVGNFASSPEGAAMINENSLYWGTGMLSGFLDNAPTYINFLTAAMASKGDSITVLSEVVDFSVSEGLLLKSISVAAVFFGAFTYIGNGPNFMVKSIAEEIGLKMPSFFGYIIRFSITILVPLYIIVWLLFFKWQIF